MLLLMFKVWLGIPGINLQVFLPQHENEATFSCFFSLTFQTLCQVSLKYIKPSGCGNDLKIASFFWILFQMSLFEIQ